MLFGNTISGGSVLSNIVREVPAGVVDGVNTVFTLSFIPVSNSEDIYINGQLRHPTVAYTLVGNTITFVIAPWNGSYLLAKYIKQ